MTKKLEELLPVEIPRELDGSNLFELLAKEYQLSTANVISASSNCVSCNNGGGCTGGGRPRYQEERSYAASEQHP